jgi:GTP-binding protein
MQLLVSLSCAFVSQETARNQPFFTRQQTRRRAPCRIRLYSRTADDSILLQQQQQQQQQEDDDTIYYSPNVPLQDLSLETINDDAIARSDASSSTSTTDPSSEYSFFDQAFILVRAGSGGQGSTAYKQRPGASSNTKQQGPPDGGNGGQGGNVILVVDPSLNTLAGLSNAWRPNSFGGSGAASSNSQSRIKSFRAENGQDGQHRCQSGRSGKDVVVRVPPGTVLQEVLEDGRQFPITTLTKDGNPTYIAARGGLGGEGTAVLLKSGRGVKRPRQSATGGQRKKLLLTLKIVADVALVAVPNAGKSTLLAAVTRAKPKIANYPFTTVIPNLGVWVPAETYDNYDSSDSSSGSEGLVLCDVPGLIAGASQGIGLGHAFLRHVERCHLILHLIDATSNDPIADYLMLNRELVNYGTGQLAIMPQVVVVNKVDALEGGSGGEEWETGLKSKLSREELQDQLLQVMPHSRLMWISAKESQGVDELMTRLAAFVKKIKSTLEEDVVSSS